MDNFDPVESTWKMTPMERIDQQNTIVQPAERLSTNQQIQWDIFNRLPLSVEQKERVAMLAKDLQDKLTEQEGDTQQHE